MLDKVSYKVMLDILLETFLCQIDVDSVDRIIYIDCYPLAITVSNKHNNHLCKVFDLFVFM